MVQKSQVDIAALIKAGHRNEDIFAPLVREVNCLVYPLYVNMFHDEAEWMCHRVLEALEAGHPFPQKYARQFQLGMILARDRGEKREQVLAVFDRMVEENLVQRPQLSQDDPHKLAGDDTLIGLFSISAVSGNLPLMKKIVDYVGGVEHLLRAHMTTDHVCPFEMAIKGGQKEVLEWLFTQMQPNDWPHVSGHRAPLLNVALFEEKDLAWIQILLKLEKTQEKNSIAYVLQQPGKRKETDLIAIIETLVSQGHVLDTTENSCLVEVIRQDHFDEDQKKRMVTRFVEMGADIHWKSHETKNNVLMYACEHKFPVEFLLDLGVNIDEKNMDGRTALFYATPPRLPELTHTAKVLIERGARLDVVDNHGQMVKNRLPPSAKAWADQLLLQEQTPTTPTTRRQARL
jgi:hypothetical protein